MLPGLQKLVFNSLRFYKKPVLYQILIIALLSAVITGSLLTGLSVRESLKKTAYQHLGNTGLVISSGTRFFDMSLEKRLRDSASIKCSGILEMNGFCQDLGNQKEVTKAHIYAVTDDFFVFQGLDTIKIKPGEVAVNAKIASTLDLKKGDDIIIRFNDLSDIPADAPFAPSNEEGRSVVMKAGAILGPEDAGNFSLTINQEVPYNIYINLSDIFDSADKPLKINRLLIMQGSGTGVGNTHSLLMKYMRPSDIGLRIIPLAKTGAYELRSDRIFLEKSLIGEIENAIPSAAPVITYLGNSISSASGSAPYSFVAALPRSLYPEIAGDSDMIINTWLAKDLRARKGDTLQMSWYAPDSLNKLIEKTGRFRVQRIVRMDGIWADSLLMPAFPGIAGRESCSDWDAGVPVKLSEIRKKDEEYWNNFRGTPKAFISYEEGARLWGNNFGPATAIRFPASVSEKEILNKLSGHLDPEKNGFRIDDLYNESIMAASESVDFSSLFLSLGFFLIVASVVLLSFAVTTYLESKYRQIRTFFALGFRSRRIGQLFIAESVIISFTGCIAGSFGGILVSMLIIRLLNTVWQGAVQTNTLSSFFNMSSVLTGFLTTIIISIVFFLIKIRLHLKKLGRHKRINHTNPSRRLNLIFVLASFIVSAILFSLSLLHRDQEISYSFGSGSVLLVAMLLAWRHYVILPADRLNSEGKYYGQLSRLYYSYNPSHAVTPVLFIAAGLFAVFITGANRMSFEGSHMKPSGGTGGFLLWCESSIPVRADLTTAAGRSAAGLDEKGLSGMRFVQMKKFAGNDASCLNLNHITLPPLLGVDPGEFISRGSFSFAKVAGKTDVKNPWDLLNLAPAENTIYGIADQTVIEWGLKIKPGDTLSMRSENGQRLNIIVAAGLKSSVFQGYVIIGMENFRRYFPSVAGSSVMLVAGDSKLTDLYISNIKERLQSYGIKVERTDDRLASFYEVTNTYLSVFGVFGILGMITGIAGLGFVLLRNYNYRRREFALMMSSGFKIRRIRRIIFSEQMLILLAGIVSGVVPASIATLPSLKNNANIPWLYLLSMVALIFLTGTLALLLSLRSVTGNSLTESLKQE